MKHLIQLMALLVCAVFASCDRLSDEPVIEKGHEYEYVGAQAQSLVLKVTNFSGQPYNHKVDWSIQGIGATDSIGNIRVVRNQLEVLPDASQRIHYEWLTCTVPRHKREIHVSVDENTTGQERRLTFMTAGEKLSGPTFTIIQKAEKD